MPRPRFEGPQRSRLGRFAFVLACAGAGLSTWACSPSSHSSTRRIAVIISGDTAGWIVPCGCTTNQSGGLPRRGTFVKQARIDRDVVVVEVGGAAGGTSEYDRIKFEAILKGERLMDLAAHNLGGPEAALGADSLRKIGRRYRVPFVSANLRDAAGVLIAEPLRVLRVGGLRIAFVGVLSPRSARAGETRIDEPRAAILKAIGDQAASSYDALVVLAYLPEAELRQLAIELPEADLVVGGPTGQSLAPFKVGPTWVASATNKGKFLIEMETSSRGGSRRWMGRVVEMKPTLTDDPDQLRNVGLFHEELAYRDLPAALTAFIAPPPAHLPDDYQIVGTETCRTCHRMDYQVWDHSRHARAWQTLQVRGDHVDPECQRCHTTGYGLPGGFRSAHRGPDRTAVGCESCHGPSQGHVILPTVKTPFVARDQCLICHDSENSPRFAFEAYWKLIRHGERASPAPIEGKP